VKRKSIQRVITLAVEVLHVAASRSRTEKVDTLEVRLALAVLWCILTDRKALDAYWHKANNVSGIPWESCREAYYQIKATLREEGWDAPQK
jgi:hypothetical protein